jgi:hypothetical protein
MSELHTSQEAAPLVGPDGLGLCCCHGHLDGLTLEEMAALGAPCPTATFIAARIAEAKAEAWDEAVATVRLYPGGMGLSCGPSPYREPSIRNEP